jgi:hypothetical protein
MLFTLGKRICQMKMFKGLWVSVQWGPGFRKPDRGFQRKILVRDICKLAEDMHLGKRWTKWPPG